jgi:hypothetical protein
VALPDVLLSCELGGWRLVIGGCQWGADLDEFSCDAGGTLFLLTPGCCGGTAPGSITVSPAGEWVSCGEEEPALGPTALTVTTLDAPRRPAGRPPPPPPCRHLGEPERLRDGRKWQRCGAGYGTRIPLDAADPRNGMVATCGGCGNRGAWRLGVECGPNCGGYQAGEGESGDTPDA